MVPSLVGTVQFAENSNETEIFLIGAVEKLSQAIDLADKINLTVVQADTKAEKPFPDLNLAAWSCSTCICTQPNVENVEDEF
jgi:dihydrofolate reductase